MNEFNITYTDLNPLPNVYLSPQLHESFRQVEWIIMQFKTKVYTGGIEFTRLLK